MYIDNSLKIRSHVSRTPPNHHFLQKGHTHTHPRGAFTTRALSNITCGSYLKVPKRENSKTKNANPTLFVGDCVLSHTQKFIYIRNFLANQTVFKKQRKDIHFFQLSLSLWDLKNTTAVSVSLSLSL